MADTDTSGPPEFPSFDLPDAPGPGIQSAKYTLMLRDMITALHEIMVAQNLILASRVNSGLVPSDIVSMAALQTSIEANQVKLEEFYIKYGAYL